MNVDKVIIVLKQTCVYVVHELRLQNKFLSIFKLPSDPKTIALEASDRSTSRLLKIYYWARMTARTNSPHTE